MGLPMLSLKTLIMLITIRKPRLIFNYHSFYLVLIKLFYFLSFLQCKGETTFKYNLNININKINILHYKKCERIYKISKKNISERCAAAQRI